MEKGKEGIATVDASKVKEENLGVAGGICWRGFWLSLLNVTGDIYSIALQWIIGKYFSETWILPFAVLLAMAAYAVLAIAFYNSDD